MERKIILSNGKTVEVNCLSCAITSGLVQPDGGVVFETEYFHAHQDVAYPVKGLVIFILGWFHGMIGCMNLVAQLNQLDLSFFTLVTK
ncbi:hypothetical protein [Bacillus nitroreducens]